MRESSLPRRGRPAPTCSSCPNCGSTATTWSGPGSGPRRWGPVGLTICYDLRFPELFRTMALAGAVLFLTAAQWPVRRVEAWLLLARARAVENELIVAACNRVGNDGQVEFPGRSLVVDPWGKTLVEGDDQERLLIAQADLREVRKARRYLTVYQDRRPDAYRVAKGEA